MTTEIAIVNRHAIALAADSAVTIGRSRVWKSANKIISLSPRNDIAIMIHNSADLLRVPWETIIKHFRDDCCFTKFDKVSDCASAFFEHIHSNFIPRVTGLPEKEASLFVPIIDHIFDRSHEMNITPHESAKKIASEVSEHTVGSDRIDNFISKQEFIERYGSIIKTICKSRFKKTPQSKTSSIIFGILYDIVSAKLSSEYDSGLVFCGFGSEELLPTVLHFSVDGSINGSLRSWCVNEVNLNTDALHSPVILPFAQDDMIFLFMEGIFKNYLEFIESSIKTILDERAKSVVGRYVQDRDRATAELRSQEMENDKTVRELMLGFATYRNKQFSGQILQVVRSLPKDEMAAMAEALVELTSLKRKVSNSIESVGGPTDVAVISKGDGVVWIKRKHYFDIDINGDYNYRRRLKIQGGQNGGQIE